jgi:hypothetical protein
MGRRAAGLWIALGLLLSLGGCANFTTKITGSQRAGAEQLLLTGTSDRAVESIDFRPLSGAKVYLDTEQIKAEDEGWVIFSLRRAMARHCVLLVEKKEAQVIVEAAVGAYGTDEVDRQLTLPFLSTPIPTPFSTSGLSPQAISRKNRQDAIVKLALTAFDAKSHHLVWESGNILVAESLDRKYIGDRNVERRGTLTESQWYPPPRGH